jgi:hypothetical protein
MSTKLHCIEHEQRLIRKIMVQSMFGYIKPYGLNGNSFIGLGLGLGLIIDSTAPRISYHTITTHKTLNFSVFKINSYLFYKSLAYILP